MAKGDERQVIARNRRAAHDYILEDHIEAGIVLQGSEIKSIRNHQVSLREAYVTVQRGEAWLYNAHIAPYDPASRENHDPRRPRKLLLHRREIDRLEDRIRQRGYTVIPTQMYLTHGLAKVEIALAKGKKKYDKRRKLSQEEARRQIDRALRRRG